LLQRFGDLALVFAEIAPRKMLIAGGGVEAARTDPHIDRAPRAFSTASGTLWDWRAL
jgi:hypothetical protein